MFNKLLFTTQAKILNAIFSTKVHYMLFVLHIMATENICMARYEKLLNIVFVNLISLTKNCI